MTGETKPIFARMDSANFFPIGRIGAVEITLVALNNVEIFAGDVVILPFEKYNELIEVKS